MIVIKRHSYNIMWHISSLKMLNYVVVTLLIASLCYYVQAKGMSGFTARHSKRSNGEIIFKDEASVTLNDGKSERSVPLMRVSADKTNFPNQAFYTNDKRSLHCLEDCRTEEYCLKRCLDLSQKGSYFYKEDDFLFIPGKGGEMKHLEAAFENTQTMDRTGINYQMYMKQEPSNNAAEKKRNTLSVNEPGSNVGTIEIAYYADKAFVMKFWDFAGSTVNDTKFEVERFLQLTTNEIALMYETLSQYNLTTTLNGATYPLDITAYMASVIFPPDDGSAFSEASWSPTSMSGVVTLSDTVYSYVYKSGAYYYIYAQFVYYAGALTDFSTYLKNSTDISTYDIAEYVTGSDIASEDTHIVYRWRRNNWYYWFTDYSYSTSVIGVAWLNGLCKTNANDDKILASGMSELFAMDFSSVIAHEFGHNAGMYHDSGTACPAGTYVMSPYAVDPSTAPSTINSFSSCSADYMKSYLDGLTSSNTEASCLYGTPPSSADFVTAFCQGLTGNYTFDRQCQYRFDNADLTACNSFTNEYVNNDECDDIVNCAETCGVTTNFELEGVFHGTRCRSPDNTEGNMICYNRECVEPSTLCTS